MKLKIFKWVLWLMSIFILRFMISNTFIWCILSIVTYFLFMKEHNGFIKKEECSYMYVERKKEFVVTVIHGGCYLLIEDFIFNCKKEFRMIEDTYDKGLRVLLFESYKRELCIMETSLGDYIAINTLTEKKEKNIPKIEKIIEKISIKMDKRYRGV